MKKDLLFDKELLEQIAQIKLNFILISTAWRS